MRIIQTLFLLCAVIALPGGCLSEHLPQRDRTSPLVVQALDDPPENSTALAEGLTWQAGWELSSKNYSFGGFSALMALDNERFLAASDRSRTMDFNPHRNIENPAVFQWMRDPLQVAHKATDLESVVPDPDTGGFWAAFERKNMIIRFDADQNVTGWRAPEAMQGWSRNAGAEAMTRLKSGEFLIVPEGAKSWFSDVHQALIFDGDPVEDVAAVPLAIRIHEGFRPVDAATLPDGQIMLLLRKFSLGFPPRFESALMIGRLTKADGSWSWKTHAVLPLTSPIPPENYEGLAVLPRKDGDADLWLISDNNMSVLQRTYLIKLRWQPKEKARGAAAR